jgi:hypothetical protein
MLFAVVTTPHIRFTIYATGDEPKYIRFAENWWQGNGMPIDQWQAVSLLEPEDQRSRLLRNFTFVAPAIRENAVSLVNDLRTLPDADTWARGFNRAESADNHVVRGKNGWHYQIHGPGLSALILPAYIIDRQFFDRGSAMFADDMFTTNLVLLLVYGALAAVLFRLVRAVGVRPVIAATASCAIMLSLPVAAFPFQFYPETTAALITCAVTLKLFKPNERLTERTAILIALALTFLGWLHIRFLVVSGVAIFWLVWRFHADRRAMVSLLVTFALGMSTLCFYAYHVTGSFLPSAPFALGVGSGFVWDRVPVGLMAMLIDRVYGLLPLAPIYFLAIPGLGLMARREPHTLAIVVTIAMALIVPSAGQGYWTDGSIPLRHALAVLPLGAIAIALWLEARGGRPLTAGATVLLLALSIRTAVAYNLQNDKSISTMLDAAFSGWDVSLLFPITHRIRANPLTTDAWQLIFAAFLIIAAFGYGALSNDTASPRGGSLRYARGFIVVLAGFTLLGCVAIALGGPPLRSELLRGYRHPYSPSPSCWIELATRPPRGF